MLHTGPRGRTPSDPPELLAPAGDWDALRAAVANGADAVYLGLEAFNARLRAANFRAEELADVLGYVHARNVKAYVTLNTLLFSDELPRAAEYVTRLAEAGADAVIVQDLGLVRLIRHMAPTLPIHASTQMTQTEVEGIEALRELGVARVILARELSLPEIEAVRRGTPLPVEVFVHGALCISYSGQCLASEALWGRSANRGQCGQACRLPYDVLVDGRPAKVGDRHYPLSPKDLLGLEHVAALCELGVAALKIEGRLKSAEYAAAAVRTYRAALDAAAGGRAFNPSPQQMRELTQSFSRGFSGGFLDGVDHQELVDGRSPKKRGVPVGTVVGHTRRGVLVRLEPGSDSAPLKAGDGVVFEPAPAGPDFIRSAVGPDFIRSGPVATEQGGRIYAVHANQNAQRPQASARRRSNARAPAARPQPVGAPLEVELQFGRADLDLRAVTPGARVWKTDDPATRRTLAQTYARDVVVRRTPLHVVATIDAGARLALVARDAAGRTAHVASEPLQAARRHPLDAALLREQLGRLGDTPFELAAVELRDAHGPVGEVPLMVPKSVLNDLRRRVVEDLMEQRAAARRHAIAAPGALEQLRSEIERGSDGHAARDVAPLLSVLARTADQVEAVCAWTAPPGVALATVNCDLRDWGDSLGCVERGRMYGVTVGLATPRVLMPRELGMLAQLADAKPAAVLVRSLGALRVLRRALPDAELVADFSLNAVNELCAAEVARLGAARVTAGLDANPDQLAAWLARGPAARMEIVAHLHVPLFHTRHCLYAANLSDGARCGQCGWPCGGHELRLRDRNGASHPVLTDSTRRNVVFHAAAQTAAEFLPQLLQAGVRHFRLELLDESAESARGLLDAYAGVLTGRRTPAAARALVAQFTPGGLTRGTWSFA